MRATLIFTILFGLIAISMAFPAPEDELSVNDPGNLIAVDGQDGGEHDNASQRKVRQFGFGGFGGHRGGFGGGGFGHGGFGGPGFGGGFGHRGFGGGFGHGGFGGGGFGRGFYG